MNRAYLMRFLRNSVLGCLFLFVLVIVLAALLYPDQIQERDFFFRVLRFSAGLTLSAWFLSFTPYDFGPPYTYFDLSLLLPAYKPAQLRMWKILLTFVCAGLVFLTVVFTMNV